jgi:hypothetical protein
MFKVKRFVSTLDFINNNENMFVELTGMLGTIPLD